MKVAKASLFLEARGGGVDLERKIWGEILWLRKCHQQQKDWGLSTLMTSFSCIWKRTKGGPYSGLLKSNRSFPLSPFTDSPSLSTHPASFLQDLISEKLTVLNPVPWLKCGPRKKEGDWGRKTYSTLFSSAQPWRSDCLHFSDEKTEVQGLC